MLQAWSHPFTPLWAAFLLFLAMLVCVVIGGLTPIKMGRVIRVIGSLSLLMVIVAIVEILAGASIF